MKHKVVFNIGTGTVVCSCGEYFKEDNHSLNTWQYVAKSAVEKWADHLKETNGKD